MKGNVFAIVISTGLGYLLPGPDFQGLLREDEHRLDRVHAAVRAAEPDPWCPIYATRFLRRGGRVVVPEISRCVAVSLLDRCVVCMCVHV